MEKRVRDDLACSTPPDVHWQLDVDKKFRDPRALYNVPDTFHIWPIHPSVGFGMLYRCPDCGLPSVTKTSGGICQCCNCTIRLEFQDDNYLFTVLEPIERTFSRFNRAERRFAMAWRYLQTEPPEDHYLVILRNWQEAFIADFFLRYARESIVFAVPTSENLFSFEWHTYTSEPEPLEVYTFKEVFQAYDAQFPVVVKSATTVQVDHQTIGWHLCYAIIAAMIRQRLAFGGLPADPNLLERFEAGFPKETYYFNPWELACLPSELCQRLCIPIDDIYFFKKLYEGQICEPLQTETDIQTFGIPENISEKDGV